jgi:hypothetical protein
MLPFRQSTPPSMQGDRIMDENVTIVFHGFLNLTTKEKLQMISEINNYFDSNDRDPIRRDNEEKFKNIDFSAPAKTCKCCGK